MLETIRQFAEEQLAATDTNRARWRDVIMPDTSPRARPSLTGTSGTGPSSDTATEWVDTEFANLRAGFRWAADHADLDVAATIATYAGLLGFGVENYEPVAWAEELIEPAVAARHPRLANLYVIASLCWMSGRIDDGLRYADVGQQVLASSPHPPPYAMEGWLGAAYSAVGRPELWVDVCGAQLERRRDNHVYIRSCRVFALAFAGSIDEARACSEGLIEAGAATGNPYMHSFTIAASSFPLSAAGPEHALEACRQGLAIARDSGNSFNESILVLSTARLEAQEAVTVEAFDHLMVCIRNYHDSGNLASIRTPLGVLSSFLDRMGRFEPAATIAGFALSPMSTAAAPELPLAIAHLRDVLGEATYETLSRKGEAMTMATATAYAYEQIDQARAELERSA